jgi:hypothetical protein
MRTQAGFHANNAGRQLFEYFFGIPALDLLTKSNLPVGLEPNEMKTSLPIPTPMTASSAAVVSILGFIAASPDPRASQPG